MAVYITDEDVLERLLAAEGEGSEERRGTWETEVIRVRKVWQECVENGWREPLEFTESNGEKIPIGEPYYCTPWLPDMRLGSTILKYRLYNEGEVVVVRHQEVGERRGLVPPHPNVVAADTRDRAAGFRIIYWNDIYGIADDDSPESWYRTKDPTPVELDYGEDDYE